MKLLLTVLVSGAILVASTCGASQTQSPSTPRPGLALTIRAVDDPVKAGPVTSRPVWHPNDLRVVDTVKAGSPVTLLVTLTNKSDKDIRVMLSGAGAEGTYKVEVRDEKGNLAPDTRLGILWNGHVDPKDFERLGLTESEILHGGSIVYYLLRAGESITQSLVATALYQMNKPGKYTIRIRKDKSQDDEVFVQSNTITVTVTP
jgi:hypothetical protein